MTPRHKVFVSYYHDEDQRYRNRFEDLFDRHFDIMVSQSVDIGDIDPNLKTETIRQKIRDEYIRDATVIVVLVGPHTWQRKHVDWEIYSGLHDTKNNPRCGLLGIFVPSYPLPGNKYDRHTIPPRLHDNIARKFTKIYKWSTDPFSVSNWIHEAFTRRHQDPGPDLSRSLFAQNRSGARWQ